MNVNIAVRSLENENLYKTYQHEIYSTHDIETGLEELKDVEGYTELVRKQFLNSCFDVMCHKDFSIIFTTDEQANEIRLGILKYMLEKYGNDLSEMSKCNGIFSAAYYGYFEVVKFLLSNGVDFLNPKSFKTDYNRVHHSVKLMCERYPYIAVYIENHYKLKNL